MKFVKKRLVASLLISMLPGLAAGAELFELEVDVDGEKTRVAYDDISTLLENVDDASLRQIAKRYTSASAASVSLKIRGLPATVSYTANNSTLHLDIPALGIAKDFAGDSRDISQDLMETYIEEDGEGILTSMLNYMAANTAVDPVAGNPNSAVSQMAASDFMNGSDVSTSDQLTASTTGSNNQIGLGIRFGRYSAGDFDQNVITIPFKYTFVMDDPRQQIRVDLPVTYVETDKAVAASASLGVGYRMPMSDSWSLTPTIRLGAAGSEDMASAAIIWSAGLTSDYKFTRDDIVYTVGNMVGYYKTESLDAGDYEIGYDLTNPMMRHGISAEGGLDYKLFGKPTSWEGSLAWTKFFGDELYIDSYFDLAFSLGTRRKLVSDWDDMRLGVTYTHGKNDFSGFHMNFGYEF
jgi:hypothetical protein